jgi:ribose-phosphate pyrophosphokinase
LVTALSVFTGSAHPALAASIARTLDTTLGLAVTDAFPDGERQVHLRQSVRGHDVFLLQPTSPPVSDHLIELLLLADACRRAGADRVTAVMPYFGYARQDRRATGRDSIGARVVADLLGVGGLSRVVAVDLHSPATEGFFPMPLEHLTAAPLLAAALGSVPVEAVILAPDLGAVRLAERYAFLLNRPIVTVHKHRSGPRAVTVRQLVGDLRGRVPIIVDDMISTGHTVAAAVRAALGAGCVPDVSVLVSHGLFTGEAAQTLGGLPISRVITSDSVPPRSDMPLPVTAVGLAPLLADVIGRLHRTESLETVLVHE